MSASRLLLPITLILQLIGAILFAIAFFPASKPSHSPLQSPLPTHPRTHRPPFDRLVFVLIDALRSDFMFGPESKMEFTQSLVRSAKALPYTAMAQAPTVTLPRIKAMTTGSNPQFLDAVLNIQPDSMDQQNSKILESSDSWLRQLLFSDHRRQFFAQSNMSNLETNNQQQPKHNGPFMKRRALFYGDDTWLRLFPSWWFAEVDGVSSFFVSDTENVDYNVTRHLGRVFSSTEVEDDLALLDWDIVILHYLGLDHVGHLAGSKSDLMGPKQKQLDLVIQRIFQNISHFDSIENRNTLLVATGDHGMTDAGNHGGSSLSELSTALLLASPSFNHVSLESDQIIKPEIVQQVDIVPTLSILFGTKIPTGSIGVAVQSILNISFIDNQNERPDFSAIRIELVNHAMQIVSLLGNVLGGGFDRVKEFLGLQAVNQDDDLESILSRLDTATLQAILHRSQDYLMTHFSGYNLPKMVLGLTIMTITSISFIFQAFDQFKNNTNRQKHFNRQEISVLVFSLLPILSFSSTSFIEEEHQSWFFLGTCSLLFFAFSAPTFHQKGLYLLGCFFLRVLRGWSDNGQQVATAPSSSISSLLIRNRWLCHLLDPIGIYYLKRSLSSARFLGQDNYGRDLGLFQFYSSIGFIFILWAGLLSLTPMNQSLFYFERYSILPSLFRWFSDFDFIYVDPGFRPRLLYSSLAIGLVFRVIFNHLTPGDSDPHKRFKLLRDSKLSLLILLRSLTKSENYIVLWISLFSGDLIQEILRHSSFNNTSVEDQVVDKSNFNEQKIDSIDDVGPCLVSTWIELVFVKSSFFALGGSNSLATVDLSNSFNGLKSFSLPIVALLTFMSNFSGPIAIGLSNFLNHENHRHSTNYQMITRKKLFRCCFFSSSLLFVCGISSFFLDHLFIFTVFSPAVLYSLAWFFGLNLVLFLFECCV